MQKHYLIEAKNKTKTSFKTDNIVVYLYRNQVVMSINRLSKEIHENAVEKGFYEDEKNTGEMLCLIHSEVSEALEADRKDNYANMDSVLWDDMNNDPGDEYFTHAFKEYCKDTFEDELVDIIIRVMDLAEFKGIDLEAHIKAKMRFNSLREHKHGKKY